MQLKTKSPLFVIFLTIFIDLVGFGMIIPLNPYLAQTFGASPFEVGALMGIFSLAQLLFSPFWGRLSDRIGRRPVIIIGLVGTGIAHIAFAFSTQLWMLYATRAFAGLFGGNISTAMAYVADVTDAKDRSKGMGLVGAAFGLGFVLGPFLGGLLSVVGISLGSEPPFGMSFVAVAAGILCLANAVLAFFVLKESLDATKKNVAPKKSKSEMAFEFLSRPVVGPLLLVSFLSVFSMSQMEPILFLYVRDVFQWDVSKASFAFAYVGVMMAFTQGFLIRKLLPRLGERKLMIMGILLSSVFMAAIGFSAEIWILAGVITFMSIGIGLRNPSLNGSVSLLCSENEQGAIMGVNQSMSALGRIVGPPVGGLMYTHFGQQIPFVLAGATALLGIPIILRLYDLIPDNSQKSNENIPAAFPSHSKAPVPMEPIGLNTAVREEVLSQVKREVQKDPHFKNQTPLAVTPQVSPSPVRDEPRPIVIDRPRGRAPSSSDASKHIKARMENNITFITSFQFRNLFNNQISFLFLDLRAPGTPPQYSRAVNTTLEEAVEQIAKRTTDKKHPILIICEDGKASAELGKKLVEDHYLNVVVLEGGVTSVNKTSLI